MTRVVEGALGRSLHDRELGNMAGMYGADVAQLRTLAQQFDRFAGDLDANRMTVGNAIRIQAWVGPVAVRFRHEWDSAHSRRVADAAQRLRDAAKTLRTNADQQERTSAVDGASPSIGGIAPSATIGAVTGTWSTVGAGYREPTLPAWMQAAKAAWDGHGLITGGIAVAKLGTAAGFLASQVRGYSTLSGMNTALQFSRAYKLVDTIDSAASFGTIAGRAIGVVGVGFGAYETTKAALEGRTGDAIWSGAKTAVAIGALLTPPPVNVAFAGASGLIAIGEVAYANREAIGRAATTALKTVTDVGGSIRRSVGGFLSNVGAAAAKRWPW